MCSAVPPSRPKIPRGLGQIHAGFSGLSAWVDDRGLSPAKPRVGRGDWGLEQQAQGTRGRGSGSLPTAARPEDWRLLVSVQRPSVLLPSASLLPAALGTPLTVLGLGLELLLVSRRHQGRRPRLCGWSQLLPLADHLFIAPQIQCSVPGPDQLFS